jgi:capsular polysaccharide biosynthesis protein
VASTRHDAHAPALIAIADVDAAAWAANPHVAVADPAYSVLARGVWHRELKLPVAADGVMCLVRHQMYKASKYDGLTLPVPGDDAHRLRHGVLFAGSASHWHFLVDGLGQMDPPAMAQGRRALYVDAEMSPEQERFIARFAEAAGYPASTVIERVSAPWVGVEDCAIPCRRRFSDKVSRLRSVLRVGNVPGPGRRVFVPRHGAAMRRLLNQSDVENALCDQLGFEIVDPAALTLDEQVVAFRDAEILVGAHGAGLANAVFSGKLRILVELFHTEPQIFYHSLCYALGAHHYTIAGTPVDDSRDAHRGDNADYAVDARRTVEIVSMLLQRHQSA